MLSKSVDYKLFFSCFVLIIFGMIMISSVSVYSSFRVTSVMESNWFISEAYNHFYLVRNISHVFISLILMVFLVKIPYSFFEKNSKYFLWVSVLLLILVLAIWPSWNWANWWINLPFLPFAIQPTEFLKFSLIIFLAYFFKRNYKVLASLEKWFLPFILLISFLILLIAMQPDFGTIMVIVPLSFIMFFIAGWNIRYLLSMALLWLLLVIWVYNAWKYDKNNLETRNTYSYITDRMDNFLSDKKEAIQNKTINYQTEQALIAIWSGGFAGLWFGNSVQKYWYLPEVQWDFIFSVISEELGFLWAFFIISFYSYIWYRGLYIAYRSKDLFARFAAVWVAVWITLQAYINIWVNLNVIPLTWITLPFVSYGWSSLLSLIMWLSLLLSISRDIDEDYVYTRWWKVKWRNLSKSRTYLNP